MIDSEICPQYCFQALASSVTENERGQRHLSRSDRCWKAPVSRDVNHVPCFGMCDSTGETPLHCLIDKIRIPLKSESVLSKEMFFVYLEMRFSFHRAEKWAVSL